MTQNTETKMFSPLQIFSKSSSTSSSSSSSSALSSTNKLKNLIETLILSHMCRLIRSLSKLKAIILNIINNNYDSTIDFPRHHNKNHYSSKTNRIILGSFRLHYNWCSSKSSTHVLPVLPTKKWNTVVPSEKQQQQEVVGENFHDLELAGYLQWLEEKPHAGDNITHDKEINEIDLRAEVFIANSHEKFRLEKQESDRRFQEMLARGL